MLVRRIARTGVTSSLALLLLVSALLLENPGRASATARIVQKPAMATASGATSVSLSFAAGPSAGNLLIAVCGANGIVTITAPSGFSTAKNEAVTPSQGIFYKVATGSEGTAALSCGGGASTTRWGMQLYEYSGLVAASPLDAANTLTSTGTGTTANSGSVTTTNANDLLIAGVTSATNTAPVTWTSSFTSEGSATIAGGTKMGYGGADRVVTVTSAYSTTVTVGNASWRGQIAAFKEISPVLSADIVDGSGNTVASPSASMSTASRSFQCQTVTGTLGTGTQKMRVSNYTTNPAWTLSIAATSGATADWSAGTPKYDFNDSSGSGCSDGADADSLAGQLTIDPSVASLSPSAGCSNTNVSLGASSAFNQGVTDSITIASSTSSAGYNCYWDITGTSLSQTIPAAQANGSYSINMTLTIAAN